MTIGYYSYNIIGYRHTFVRYRELLGCAIQILCHTVNKKLFLFASPRAVLRLRFRVPGFPGMQGPGMELRLRFPVSGLRYAEAQQREACIATRIA